MLSLDLSILCTHAQSNVWTTTTGEIDNPLAHNRYTGSLYQRVRRKVNAPSNSFEPGIRHDDNGKLTRREGKERATIRLDSYLLDPRRVYASRDGAVRHLRIASAKGKVGECSCSVLKCHL